MARTGSETEGSARTPDPFELWRQLYDANERAWTTALEQAMGHSEFGAQSGKLLETMLAAQKAARESMRTYLETINVPTREDIGRLGELIVGLEEKVDELIDRIDELGGTVEGLAGAAERETPKTGQAGRRRGSRARAGE